MNNYDVHLTFKTDKVTSELLKKLAHMLGKTQPEFINEICKEYVEMILGEMKKDIEKHKES